MTQQLQQAIKLIRSGDKAGGKSLLIKILKDEPADDRAWMWMAAAVETDELRRECLEEALRYNPENRSARRALDKLEPAAELQPDWIVAKPPEKPAVSKKQATTPATTAKGGSPSPGLLIALLLIGLAFILLSIPSVRNELRLREESVVTEAQVVEWRVMVNRRQHRSYEVRYQFYAPEQGAWYSAADETGRDNLWATLPEEEWNVATNQGRLQVVYLPSNPRVNRPASDRGNLRDALFGGLLGLVFTLIALALFVQSRP